MMTIKMEQLIEGYKSSDLGKIPMEWEILILKDVLRVGYGKNQRSIEVEKSEIPILGTGGIIGYAKQPLFDKPSVLIGRKGTIDKPRYIETPFWTIDTLFYTEIDLSIASPKFIYYLFQTIDWYKYNEATGVPSLSANNISKIPFRNPPLKEQKKIAEILSAADEQIEKTEQLIEKTKELKKGLMQQLLTKGIGHTEFKQTELGEIPLNWSIYSLSEVAVKVTIGLVTTMTKFYVDKGSPLIRNSDIKEGKINTANLIKLDEDFAEKYKTKKLQKDDIVTVHTGDIGTSAIITQDMEGAHGFATLNTTVNKELIHPEYLMMYFNSAVAKKQFYNVSTGDGRNNLNLKDFIKTMITVPNSLEEQKRIIDIFESLNQQLNCYEKEMEKQLKLKKALMQQLLTGKIRVTV